MATITVMAARPAADDTDVGLSGRLLAAPWDPWPTLDQRAAVLSASDGSPLLESEARTGHETVTLFGGRAVLSGNPAGEPHVEGDAQVKCTVTEEGKLVDCTILRSVPFMDRAVLEALASWRFSPATRRGRAVAVEQVFTVRLALPR